MYYFKQMCESVSKGIAGLGDFEPNAFYRAAEQARSIVVYDVDDLRPEINEQFRKPDFLKHPLPFKVCAFEFHGKSKAFQDWGDEHNPLCVVIEEVSPGRHISYVFYDDKKTGRHLFRRFDDSDGKATFEMIITCICALLDKLSHGQKVSTDFVRIVNRAGNKQKHWIRKVVHICAKQKREELDREDKLQIDWSHRWEVRGHWRDIAGIGKDRCGEYCVKGKTWVMEHVKGPEDLPVIRKVRVYKEQTTNHQQESING